MDLEMNVLVISFHTSETLRIPASVQLLLLTFIILLSIRNSGLSKKFLPKGLTWI